MTQKKFPLDELVIDPRCQARAELHPDVVDEYADAYRAKAELPAIEVFLVDGKPWVVDGMHRYAAQVKAAVGWARTIIVGSGTEDEAIWRALASNKAHGVRRSNADKRRAIRLALESAIGIEQSSRALAEHLGVSHPFVSSVRSEWEAEKLASSAGDVETVSTSPKKLRDSVGRMQPAVKPNRAPKERLVLDVAETPRADSMTDEPEVRGTAPAAEDEVPAFDGLPGYGPALIDAAKEVAHARAAVAKIALPHNYAQSVASSLKSVEANLRYGVPEVCPRCSGAKCIHCRDRGWVEKSEGDGLRASVKAMAR